MNKTDRRSFLKASTAAATVGAWTALGGRISLAAEAGKHRIKIAGDNPCASAPTSAARASEKSPVDTPFKYNQGISSSILLVLRRYGGSIEDVKELESYGDVQQSPKTY